MSIKITIITFNYIYFFKIAVIRNGVPVLTGNEILIISLIKLKRTPVRKPQDIHFNCFNKTTF